MTTTTKKAAPTLSQETTKALEGITTTSGKVRYLASIGMTKGDIHRTLGIRYQHVRNVLLQPLKKAS